MPSLTTVNEKYFRPQGEFQHGHTFVIESSCKRAVMSNARFLGSVKFLLKGDLELNLSDVLVPGTCSILCDEEQRSELCFDAHYARFGGNFTIKAVKLSRSPNQTNGSATAAANLGGAQVAGDLCFEDVSCPNAELLLDSAHVGKRLIFRCCNLYSLNAKLLVASEIQFNESVVTSSIDLERARIEGSLNVRRDHKCANGDKPQGEQDTSPSAEWGAINLHQSVFERGGIYFHRDLTAKMIDLRGARVCAKIEMREANFRVEGDVPGFDGTALRCDSSVDLDGSTIGLLKLAGARIAGRVFHGESYNNGAPARGVIAQTVDVRSAEVAEIDLILNDTLKTVDLSGAKVRTLFLRKPPSSETAAPREDNAATSFKIQGLEFQDITIERDAEPRAGWQYQGPLAWLGAVIALAVAATLTEHGGWVLLPLGVYAALSIPSLLRETSAQVRRTATRENATRIVGWLDSSFSKQPSFDRAFFVWVERWLRERGEDGAADEVFLLRKRHEGDQKRETEGWLSASAAWSKLLDLTIAYGVRPRRLLHAFVLLWFSSWILFLNPHSVSHPSGFPALNADQVEKAIRDGTLAQSSGGALIRANSPLTDIWVADGSMPSACEWSPINALVVATRIQFPITTVLGESDWAPSSRAIQLPWGAVRWLTYENLTAILGLLNFALLPLLLAGLTGYIKRRS